jgi:Arc/MetJ-type ribon-helix-helix transcriptional regulator
MRSGLNADSPARRVHSVKTITVVCPEGLHEQLQNLVESGWVNSAEEALLEALRRFLDSHRLDLQQAQVMEDVHWGLHGDD